MPKDAPDQERVLIRALKQGSEEAFLQLLRRHQHQVFGLCCRMLSDQHEAEDVAQEVFISVFKSIQSFREECRLSTWLYRVTRNCCLNRIKLLRRRWIERESAYDEAIEKRSDGAKASISLARPAPTPDRILEGKQLEELIEKHLLALGAEHRELLLLRDIENLSYEEIQVITGLPEGTVKSRIHRARLELARALEPFLKEEED